MYLVIGIIYWGAKVPGHHHVKHTISELGEFGSPFSRQVSWGLFLMVGALLLIAGFLSTDHATARGLAACLGTGYVVAAFFPCDVGSPLGGSGRQQIHNLGGFVEYAGGAFFIFQAAETELPFVWLDYKTAGMIVIAGIVLVSIPGFFLRGLAQRITELILFGSLLQFFWVSFG